MLTQSRVDVWHGRNIGYAFLLQSGLKPYSKLHKIAININLHVKLKDTM